MEIESKVTCIEFIHLYCDECEMDYAHDPEDGYDWTCPKCGEEMAEID